MKLTSFNLFRFFSFRSLWSSKLRSALTLTGVALGIALQCGISSINRSTLASFRKSVEATVGKATLSITAGEAGFDEKIERQIRKIPGIKTTAPMVQAHVYYKTRQGAEPLVLFGIDMLKEQSVRTYKEGDQIIDDPLEFLNEPDSIILTRRFARVHHLKKGSKIELTTSRGDKRFTVRGLLSPVGPAQAYGGNIAIMDIDGARYTLGIGDKDDRIDIVLQPGASRAKVKAAAEKLLGPGFKVLSPQSQTEELHRVVAAFQGMLSFMSVLALVIGLFLVYNSVSVSVAEKRREIGSLRALGATRSEVLRMILLENVFLGALAGGLGAALGELLANGLAGHVAAAMSAQTVTHVTIDRIEFGRHDVLTAVALGAIVSLVAAIRPAIRAMKIAPIEALRPKGTESPEPIHSGGLSKLPALGLILLSGLLVFKLPEARHWFNPRTEQTLNLLQPMLGILGAILVTPWVVRLCVNLALRVFSRAGGREGSWIGIMAMENLLRNPGRTLNNVMSTLIGLMLVVIIGAVHVSFRETLTSWLGKAMAVGDMAISSNGNMAELQVQPLQENLLQAIRKIPGVDLSDKHPIIVMRYLRVDYGGKSLAIKAMDPVPASSGFRFIDAVDRTPLQEGQAVFDPKTPSVLVSENFVRNFDKTTGDTIELDSPSGPVHLKIAGIVRDLGNPDGVFYLDRSLIKRYWKDNLVTAFFVSAAPGVNPTKLLHRFNSTLGSRGIITTMNRDLVNQLMSNVDQSFSFNAAIELAALLVGLIALINTMLVSVLERTRELGMLRAVGMERKQVASMILWESLVQGALGALAAILLGGYLGWLWVTVNLSTALGWLIHFVFPTEAVLQVFVLGVMVAGLAGLLPAVRAARLDLKTSLKHE